jgi:hypothetical protein
VAQFNSHAYPLARLHARQALVRQEGLVKGSRAMAGWDPDLVDVAAAQAASADPAVAAAMPALGAAEAAGTAGALGDGTIIQAILDFFKSPQGQAVIAALVKLLLTALGA